MDLLPRLRPAVPWALSAAVIGEVLLLSPVPVPLPAASVWIPASVTRVRELPAGAVLDWPQKEPGASTEISRYAYYQAWHGRPVWFDLSDGIGPTGIETNPFFAALERVTYADGYRSEAWSGVSDLPAAEGVNALAGMGYGWLVYHPWHVAPERQEAVATWLSDLLVLQSAEPDGSRVYALRLKNGR